MSYISVANFGTSIPCDHVVQGLRASYQSPMQAFLAIILLVFGISIHSGSCRNFTIGVLPLGILLYWFFSCLSTIGYTTVLVLLLSFYSWVNS